MKCKLCEDKILEYLYGELGKEEAAAMEQHLEASDACRQAYEGYSSVLETVDEEGEEGPSPALHTRIMGHAEEARPARRSFWAWMFRPAVTTAVIGAVAAGVYFTSLRHKPPSLLDERTLSEKSLVGKSKQRRSPPERLEAHEKSDPVQRARPVEKKSRRMAVGSMDEELAPAQVRKKLETLPAEEDRAITGGMERAPSPTHERRQESMAPSTSPGRDLAYEEATVPDAIAQALNLASEGQCIEAGKRVEAYATDHPKEKASGAGWLEAARCYAKKGNTKAAREMAEEALRISAYESEARTFLATLPP